MYFCKRKKTKTTMKKVYTILVIVMTLMSGNVVAQHNKDTLIC